MWPSKQIIIGHLPFVVKSGHFAIIDKEVAICHLAMKWPFMINTIIFPSHYLWPLAWHAKNIIHYSTFSINMLLRPCILTPTGLRITGVKIFSKRGWYLSHNIYLSFAVWSIQRFGSWAINILIFICNTIRKTFSVFWDKLKTLIWLDNLCQQKPLEPWFPRVPFAPADLGSFPSNEEILVKIYFPNILWKFINFQFRLFITYSFENAIKWKFFFFQQKDLKFPYNYFMATFPIQ